LTAVLQNAQPGDEIWVAQETYKPTANNGTSISFIFKNGAKVYGGFNGTETTLAQDGLPGYKSSISICQLY
jgi:hypothetical protein